MIRKLVSTLSRSYKKRALLFIPISNYSTLISNNNIINEEKSFKFKIITDIPLTNERKKEVEHRKSIIKLIALDIVLTDIMRIIKEKNQFLLEHSVNKYVETNKKNKFMIFTDEKSKEGTIRKIDINDTNNVQSDNIYYEIIFNNKEYAQVFLLLSKNELDAAIMKKCLIEDKNDKIQLYIPCKDIDIFIESFYKLCGRRFTHEITYSSKGRHGTTFIS